MSEWIEWNGGEMPISWGAEVIVRLITGEERKSIAGKLCWDHNDDCMHITAYKILKEEPKGHPNASILMEIAKEAAVNPKFWEKFDLLVPQFEGWSRTIESERELFEFICNGDQIRRKPRTIRIGNYDVPEPMRDYPKIGDVVYGPSLCANDMCSEFIWRSEIHQIKDLEDGLIHKEKQSAVTHTKALRELLRELLGDKR